MTSSSRAGTIICSLGLVASRPAKADLTVGLTELPQGLLVCAQGIASASCLAPLEFLLTRALARRPALVVLDFSELSLLSSLAMGFLVRFGCDLARWGGRLMLAGTSEEVRESLEAARLAHLFDFHATVADVLAEVA